MREKKEDQAALPDIQKDTLIIIGNGFDIWQGIHTSYAQFQAYYFAHRDTILKKLHIKKHTIIKQDGTSYQITDVEIIYGDPFDPSELDDTFWGTFETSLSDVDAERINLFFGKEKNGLRDMKRSLKNASRILKEAFCGWITSLVIENREVPYHFGENCLFINFNYTDTLLKRFKIDPDKEFHIHGEASDKGSIIFGHSAHPQFPIEELSLFGGRFQGLYLVENLLYETDKHTCENIFSLSIFLASHRANKESIRDIYVLGHSMSPPDLEYFRFLMNATQTGSPLNSETGPEELADLDPMEELDVRINYAIQHYGYQYAMEPADPRQEQVMARQLKREQDAQRERMERKVFRKRGIWHCRRRANSEISSVHEPRTEDAIWHLSYYGDSDKAHKEEVLHELGCKRYELLPTIDACLKKFHT